ncbi:MAG: terminase small subunit [Verrucomicrobiaceae bacterium]|nr:MAG: terminase small subunit [Verrucomicrobiaceae bacterium]
MNHLSPRQKKFVDLYLEGLPAGAAYTQAGYQSRAPGRDASKLLRTGKIAAYVTLEQEVLNSKSRLNKEQMMNYLTHIILTPIGRLTEESLLTQEYNVDPAVKGGIRKRVKMIGKMDAIKQLCSMMGWNAPQQHHVEVHSQLAEMVRKARAGERGKVES